MTDAIHSLSLGILAFSALLVMIRAWRGPSVFDRALAMETISLLVMATLLLHTSMLVDAALGLALFTFVTTVVLGYFLGQGEFPHE